MINEIKSCERLQKLLDDNAKLRAIPNERKSTADSCSTGCKHGDVHSRGWRRSHHHILPLISPIVELQGTLRKDTELISVACSQAAHVTLRLKVYAFTFEQKHFRGATCCGNGKFMPMSLNFLVIQHTNLALIEKLATF